MSIKPNYIFFYTSEGAVDKLMDQSAFRYNKPTSVRRSKESALIKYEHFDIRCMRAYSNIGDRFRGYRTWQILVEDILYDNLTQESIDHVLLPMMCVYDILGGRIVKIDFFD
ncbi:hypothetical protein G9F71_008910 [Clostridium sp. FP2]|uniref:hypothetical protein n=1 Tax=Clostridium sp. FP2 TaxID=2724481 RepID=UPI0013E95BDF|nr:hypothetical protein [Clostridium sp. FP2]MBZ9622974.1 hypothetical protein [Clostridium sp. FP2]